MPQAKTYIFLKSLSGPRHPTTLTKFMPPRTAGNRTRDPSRARTLRHGNLNILVFTATRIVSCLSESPSDPSPCKEVSYSPDSGVGKPLLPVRDTRQL